MTGRDRRSRWDLLHARVVRPVQMHILGAIADYAERAAMRSGTAGAGTFAALQGCDASHYPGSASDAISASGALNCPRRNPGGSTASIASNFSDGSTRE